MAVTWITPPGSLGILTERIIVNIPIEANSDLGEIEYSLLSGKLPRGLRLRNNRIIGSPVEVSKFTESKFVIRASDASSSKDRTFILSVDGSDEPRWLTDEGFLNVGAGKAFFVLDNAQVDFQLEATDPDITAGDKLEYYLVPNGGELPPGLSLSRSGRITGFTDPIFSVIYDRTVTGAYDTASFDTAPLDVIKKDSNGFDTFFYDIATYDFNDPSRAPRRLSRIYTFAVAVSDGLNAIARIFKIYVVTEEFLKADNNIVQIDTNLFTADATNFRVPLWITPSNLGKYRANNYVAIFLDVYDPPSLSGTILYFLQPKNPDQTDSQLPPGMFLDQFSGNIAGVVPYQRRTTKSFQFTLLAVNFPEDLATRRYNLRGQWQTNVNYSVNDAVIYSNQTIFVARKANRNRIPTDQEFWDQANAGSEKTFNVDIFGEIDSAIEWISDSFLGNVKPNQPSLLKVEAKNLLSKSTITFELQSGNLPPGLELLPSGLINGKVRQFSDETGPGIARFFDRDSSLEDSTRAKSFDVIFDGETTSFDKVFSVTIRARDNAGASDISKDFQIEVISDNVKTFSNVFLLALQSKSKRLQWFDFITDVSIFRPEDIYRYGDRNFGIQTDIKILVYAGIESRNAISFVQAISRNHYRKRILFGEPKIAKAKDPITQELIYEVIYINIIDDLENQKGSISTEINLPDYLNSQILVSYDAIKVDSDIPFVSDRDHQRVFPNSIRNMRRRIKSIGDRDREFLPLWMRSIQDGGIAEPGYVKSLVLCYVKPGKGESVLSRIKANGFDFKSIDFESDRYLIDSIDGEIQDKYLAFPQRGEKLP
jgi:hypothetical protein